MDAWKGKTRQGFINGLATLWIFMLLLLSGALNVSGLMRFGQTLSHMSGNIARLGMYAILGEGKLALVFLGILLSFFMGSAISGFLLPAYQQASWAKTGLTLAVFGGIILLGEFFQLPELASMLLISLVLGAQNGLSVRFKGILTRTTHITGHITDAGAALGRMFKRQSFLGEDRTLFFFHLACLLFFGLGGALAALLDTLFTRYINLSSLVPVACLYLLFGALTMLRGMDEAPNL